MDSRINTDYSRHRTMKEHFDMLAEEVYTDSELAAILLKDNNSLQRMILILSILMMYVNKKI
jgi:hypothetical protein